MNVVGFSRPITPAFSGSFTAVRALPVGQAGQDSVRFGGLGRKLKIGFWAAALATLFTGVSMPTTAVRQQAGAQTFLNNDNVAVKFFVPKSDGTFKETGLALNMRIVEHQIARQMMEMLQDRPDLRAALKNAPKGLEIRLYKAEQLQRGNGGAHVGLAEITADGKLGMEFATKTTDQGLELGNDGFEVASHELTHILDYMELLKDGTIQLASADGYLSGWTAEQKAQFAEARAEEIPKIKAGTSPMRSYALTNDAEFLATAVENFFENGAALKASNKVIYGMLQDYFGLDPAVSTPVSILKETAKGDISVDYLSRRDQQGVMYLFGGVCVLLLGGRIYIGRKIKKAEQK